MTTKLIQYLTVTLDESLKPDSTFIGTAVQTTEYAYILKIYCPNIDVDKDSCYLAVELPTSQLDSNKIKLPVKLCADFEEASNGLYLAQIELDNRIVKYPGNVLCNIIIQHDTGDKTTEEVDGHEREVELYTTSSSETFNIKVLRSANYDEILYHNDEDYDEVSDHLNAIMASLARYKRNISSNANCIWYEETCPTGGDLSQYADSCIFTFDDHSIYLIDEDLNCTKIARLYDTQYDTYIQKMKDAIANSDSATSESIEELKTEMQKCIDQTSACATQTSDCAVKTAACAQATSDVAKATAEVANATAQCSEQTANCATATANCATQTANCATETAKATQAAADATTAVAGIADTIIDVFEEQLGIEDSDLNTLEGYRKDCQDAAESAQTSATNASGYADNAQTYAGNAQSSASSASGYADNASSSASSASGYADNASSSASAASQSASEAASSASSALSYLNSTAYWAQQVKQYQHNFCFDVHAYSNKMNYFRYFTGYGSYYNAWGRIWFNIQSSGSSSPLTSDGTAYSTFYTMLKSLGASVKLGVASTYDVGAGLIPCTGYIYQYNSTTEVDELKNIVIGIGADSENSNTILLLTKAISSDTELMTIRIPLNTSVTTTSSGLYGGTDNIVQVAGIGAK